MKADEKTTIKSLTKKVEELESDIKRIQNYKRLFEHASIAIWNEDFTQIFKEIAAIKKLDVTDFKSYLKQNTDVLESLQSKSKIDSVNDATLKLFKAANVSDFIEYIQKGYTEGFQDVFSDLMLAIWNNETSFTSEVNYKTLEGHEFTALYSIQIPQTRLEQKSVPVLVQNIQALKEAQAQNRETLFRLKQSQKLGQMGSWSWNWETDQAFWSDEMYRIYGVKKGEFEPNSYSVSQTILDEDRHKVSKVLKQLFNGVEVDSFEYKFVKPNNEIRDLSIVGMKIIEGTLYGVTQDVTERKKIEKSLNEAQAIAKIGSWNYTLATQKIEWSDETFRLWGFDPKEGPPDFDTFVRRIHKDDQAYFTKTVERSIKLGSSYKIDHRICLPGGIEKSIRAIGQPIFGANGTVIGLKGTSQDISEQKTLAIELIEAKEKAEESDRLKSAFLANMSHEIRTPMNGILGFSELLKKDNISEEKKKTYIDLIGKEGNRLLNFISNIVDISKIESNVVTVNKSSFNINELLDDLYSKYAIKIEKSKVKLIVGKGLEDKECFIETDTNKLVQILSNLIENAIKFTETGNIRFGYTVEGKELQFYVRDTGVGIEPEEQKNIFNRFTQGKQEATHNHGVGLGLSIVQGLTNILGGEVSVDSDVGLGSTFYFTLPYKKVVPQRKNSRKAVEPTLTDGPISILIAEDDEFSFMYLKECLIPYNCNILHASNGEEAVQIARLNPTLDLILMDINMPIMNGDKALEEIRKADINTPIIAQTGLAMTGDKEKMLKIGFNDYISKPISPNSLFETINKHLLKTNTTGSKQVYE